MRNATQIMFSTNDTINMLNTAKCIRYCTRKIPKNKLSMALYFYVLRTRNIPDAVECLFWSRKLSNGEHGQYLDGCPLHVTNGGSGGILVFGGESSSGWVLYGRGVVQTRQWKSSEKNKGMCWDVCRPGAKGVSLCMMETVALPNIQGELTLSFGTKFPWDGGSVTDSIRRNLNCLARQLAFLVMW
jgi:hypothetical protein